MSEKLNEVSDQDRPFNYQIRLKGRLGDQWSDWLDGLMITPEEDGNTMLSGPLIDDAALYGLLKKVHDLGMPLLSVNRIEPNPADIAEKSSVTAAPDVPHEE